jgi:hypothetical protein
MKGLLSFLALALLSTGCSNVTRQTPDFDRLSALAADPDQKDIPHWVSAIPPYPLKLFKKVEIDLNSIRETSDGGITVWERETYIDEQVVSPQESFRIAEGRYWFDCVGRAFGIEHVHTRKADGTLVRSRSIEITTPRSTNPIPPRSLISTEAELACGHVKKP